MIHVMQLLMALVLILIGIWVLQVFTYGIGGVLFGVCWIGLILIVFLLNRKTNETR